MPDIQLYDATLRDGMGGGGLTLTAEEKVRVVHSLDALGVDLIEAGFPASNPKEQQLFELLAEEPLEISQIVAFGMTRRRGGWRRIAVCLPCRALSRCGRPRVGRRALTRGGLQGDRIDHVEPLAVAL